MPIRPTPRPPKGGELVTRGDSESAAVQRALATAKVPPGSTVVYKDPSTGEQKHEKFMGEAQCE